MTTTTHTHILNSGKLTSITDSYFTIELLPPPNFDPPQLLESPLQQILRISFLCVELSDEKTYALPASKNLESLLLGQVVHVQRQHEFINREGSLVLHSILSTVRAAFVDCSTCAYPDYLLHQMFEVEAHKINQCVGIWKNFTRGMAEIAKQSPWRVFYLDEGIVKWNNMCPAGPTTEPRKCKHVNMYPDNDGENEGCDYTDYLVCKCDSFGVERAVTTGGLLFCPVEVDKKQCNCLVSEDGNMPIFLIITVICCCLLLLAMWKWNKKYILRIVPPAGFLTV
jgi:hypothetical protein